MFGNLRWRFASLAVLWVMLVEINSQSGTNFCISRQTCHECVQTQLCAWCMKPDLSERRCFYAPGTDISKFCPEEYVFYPSNELRIIEGRNLSSEMHYSETTITETDTYTSQFNATCCGAGKHDAVQITPQEVSIKVRVNQAQKIRIAFSQAEDYPVDLYYLMDLSKSMQDDKEKLSSLGSQLVSEMSNLTSNFRVGFGSFVEKVELPFVNIVPKKLKEPCDDCAAPYGYKHILPLCDDADLFSKLVRDAPVSGNLDAPEGGFDAMMQAIVCKKEIGWRDRARRLLVFSTDNSFHFAGDGRLAGIIKPNDGMCHLNSENMYTHSSVQDYPSIPQINQKVQQNSVNIIWAVTDVVMSTYSRLCSQIEGSSVGVLSEDSSNIVELIKQQYNQIRSTVEIRDTVVSEAVKIKYWSKCLRENGDILETTKCDGLQKGDKVEFIAEITATHCPTNRSEWNQAFMIYPVGINESMRVNLEIICDCDCERPEHPTYEINSPKCSYSGTYKCGSCECNPLFFGKKCECNSLTTSPYKAETCRHVNTTLVDCSGRGECICGTCDCNRPNDEYMKIWGDYCECDNFSCDRRDNKFCSGNGDCDCNGMCKCYPGWTGIACDCVTTTDTCKRPGSNILCSGKGDCACGQCVCHEENGMRYSGPYCEKCRTCPNRCEELNPCVMCQVENWKIGNYTAEECAANCPEIQVEVVEKIDKTLIENDETLCYIKDDKDCSYVYLYYYNETKLIIKAQKEEDYCPPVIYLLGVILAVVAGIVLTGVAMLASWKTFATIKDKQEFARFEKERMMAKWDAGENPIYKQATSTFKNPTYAGR